MNWGVLIAVLIYEVVSIVGIGAFMAYKNKKKTIDTIVTNGCLMYHFGNAINMAEMMSHVPENLIAMGNIDPAGEFRNGTAESVYNRTKEVMDECCKYKNFVISSGCDIPPMSPWENINAFFQAVEDFYAK